MKVLASYFLSFSSRPVLSNVHRIGSRFSSRFSRNTCTSNPTSTSTSIPALEKTFTANHFVEISKVYSCESTWAIQNFRLLRGIDLTLGKAFSPKDIKYGWFMKLYNSEGSNSSNDSSLNLALQPSNKAIGKFGGVSGEIEFALIDADGEKSCVKKKPFIVQTTDYEVVFDEFIKRTDLFEARDTKSLLPDGTLTIYCQVSFVLINEIDTIVEDTFSRYFKDKESSDFTIKLRWNKYPVHTFVLAARSPVFKEMFERDVMKNPNRNSIIVQNIDENVFVEMLRFIYTGKVEMENLKDMKFTFDLLLAADKYKVQELKNICENEIVKKISESYNSAREIRVLSSNHNLPEFETKAKRYMLHIDILKSLPFGVIWIGFCAVVGYALSAH